MQTRRQAVSPPSLVPPHPQLFHNRPSLLSPAPPHTPRSRAAPLPLFSPSANRKSSDSWNSSTHDDEVEWEWKQEEALLLQRTLDALPAHLLTPFNGPVPPSNLLDKIARGVAHAKGPAEWPHSLRATRAKIVELARVRAKEAVQVEIVEEPCEDDPRDILRPTGRTNRKRPLYRQSSMDFILDVDPSIKDNIKDNQTINRLSQRLQRTERILPNPTYHPYSRPSSPVKTRTPRNQYSPVLNPSTPSSTTLNSASSLSSASPQSPDLRRSFSSMSSSSDAYSSYPMNPRVQRIKRADSCVTPVTSGWGNSLKRAPSFGATSIRSSESNTMSVDESLWREKEVISSDEEEKLRSKKAKKARRRSPPVSPSPTEKVHTRKPSKVASNASAMSPLQPASPRPSPKPNAVDSTKKATRPRANLERNPSILGGELPNSQPHVSSPGQRTSIGSEESGRNSGFPSTPATHKTLRRVKATSFAARPMARRISFSNMISPLEENREPHGMGAGLGLGSAFQLN